MSRAEVTAVIRTSEEMGIPVGFKLQTLRGVLFDHLGTSGPRKMLGLPSNFNDATVGQVEEFVRASEGEAEDGQLDPLAEFLKALCRAIKS